MNTSSQRIMVLGGLVLLGALSRLVPHPPNFTSIAAVALFSGVQFSDKRYLSLIIPMAAMLVADLFIGFHSLMPVTYFSLALIVLIGQRLGGTRSPLRIVGSTLVSSLVFFLISNLGVWLVDGMYPMTVAGLMACYVAAIPFLGNFILGTFAYSGLLFGAMSLFEHFAPALRSKQSIALT